MNKFLTFSGIIALLIALGIWTKSLQKSETVETQKYSREVLVSFFTLDSKLSLGLTYVEYSAELSNLKLALDKFQRLSPNSMVINNLKDAFEKYSNGLEVWRSAVDSCTDPFRKKITKENSLALIKLSENDPKYSCDNTYWHDYYQQVALSTIWVSAKLNIKDAELAAKIPTSVEDEVLKTKPLTFAVKSDTVTPQIYSKPSISSTTFKFPMDSCGDSSTGGRDTWYPVFVDFTEKQLSDIKVKYCRDAIAHFRKEKGKQSIQVASFTSNAKAEELAGLLKTEFGSGEVGKPSYPVSLDQPTTTPITSTKRIDECFESGNCSFAVVGYGLNKDTQMSLLVLYSEWDAFTSADKNAVRAKLDQYLGEMRSDPTRFVIDEEIGAGIPITHPSFSRITENIRNANGWIIYGSSGMSERGALLVDDEIESATLN